MVRVKGDHWTADFTIAHWRKRTHPERTDRRMRRRSGGAATSLGRGQELLAYYPNVLGTVEGSDGRLAALRHLADVAGRLIIGIRRWAAQPGCRLHRGDGPGWPRRLT